jgi:hypothetical protein
MCGPIMNRDRRGANQNGFAILIALIVLSLVSVIGLYLALVATAEVHISDNYESLVRARAAAWAGLNHGRTLLRGLRFEDLLEGPDGSHQTDAGYLAKARTHSYRTPIPWSAARIMNILNPEDLLAGFPDDGVINTGRHTAGNGTVLIPLAGIAQMTPDPNRPGMKIDSRYFVKISDNNGEVDELAGDPANNPFFDGDGVVILRSMGIAQTIAEATQLSLRRNSVAVFEARFKRLSTFDLEAPLVVQGSAVAPASANMFNGNMFLIQGGTAHPGIATIDTVTGDESVPASLIASQMGPAQENCVQGLGLQPSVQDRTAAIEGHADKRLLLNPASACTFLKQSLPRFADRIYSGAQNWIGSAPDSLGRYHVNLPQTSPSQDPRVTFVDGDLTLDGEIEGGGLLVVTGRLAITGHFIFNGLILILGTGELDSGGFGMITGGVYVASLACANRIGSFGNARLTVRDRSQIIYNRDAIRMALTLIPPLQLSFREITTAIDPSEP